MGAKIGAQFTNFWNGEYHCWIIMEYYVIFVSKYSTLNLHNCLWRVEGAKID